MNPFERSGFCVPDKARSALGTLGCKHHKHLAHVQEKLGQGVKDQVEMIAVRCIHLTALAYRAGLGIFFTPALSKSSIDAKASLCGMRRAGTKILPIKLIQSKPEAL